MTAPVSVTAAIDTLTNQTEPVNDTKEMANTTQNSSLDGEPAIKPKIPKESQQQEQTIPINPLLSEFIDCIENLPGRLQLLLSELRNVDAQVNLRHRKITLIRQQIFSETIAAAATTFSASKSDGGSSTSSSSYSDGCTEQTHHQSVAACSSSSVGPSMHEAKVNIEQRLNKLHQILLECQLLGDQKVKLTGQIMEILSTKTRKVGLDTKSNEERNFQVELDEEKIVNEFKIAIKKRSMHAKKNHLTNGVAGHSGSSRASSRHHNNQLNLQSGSSKSKQQHLNSAEINKAVAKYTKPASCNDKSVIEKFLSFDTRATSPIDAYSFDNEEECQMATLNSRLKSHKHEAAESDVKSLRSLNNLMNGSGSSKKSSLRNKYEKLNGSVNSNKKSSKKMRDGSLQYAASSSPKSRNAKMTDNSPQSLNNRPKRHSTYTTPDLNKSTEHIQQPGLTKKRRLNQLKTNKFNSSSQLALTLSNDNSMNQCQSPSSSSTSSMNNISKQKRHKSNVTGTKLAAKNNEKLQPRTAKENTRLKQHQKSQKAGDIHKVRMVKKNKKSISLSSVNKTHYMSRRNMSRIMENQDDADDDLSDEIDEYSANHFDSDNDGDTDIENRQFNKLNNNNNNGNGSSKGLKTSSTDNEDLNSNETESINELDELNNSGGDEIEDDGDVEGNDSRLTDNDDDDDDETDEDYQRNHNNNNNKKLKYSNKGYGYNKNYESYNEENSENDQTLNTKTTSKSKANRIKSLLYEQNQQQVTTKSSAKANLQVDFPIDPSEPIYCICSEISYGQMIGCDNDSCKIEWFHFECVKLSSKPKGKWYCPHCRGDSHKTMKKFTNHNTSSPSSSTNYNYNSYRTK